MRRGSGEGFERTQNRRWARCQQRKAAVNFYVPASLAFCRGLELIKAENPSGTEVINIAVPDPRGPYGGLCAEHRNIDSDPRVWKGIFDHVIKKLDRQQPNFIYRAS